MEIVNRVCAEGKYRRENRKFLRFSLSLSAECHYNNGEIPGQCRVVNICDRGLGCEIETNRALRYGQNVLIRIILPDKPLPLSALLTLQWIKIPLEGEMVHRVGGQLLYMDMGEKSQLMQHAYAEVLAGISKKTHPYRDV